MPPTPEAPPPEALPSDVPPQEFKPFEDIAPEITLPENERCFCADATKATQLLASNWIKYRRTAEWRSFDPAKRSKQGFVLEQCCDARSEALFPKSWAQFTNTTLSPATRTEIIDKLRWGPRWDLINGLSPDKNLEAAYVKAWRMGIFDKVAWRLEGQRKHQAWKDKKKADRKRRKAEKKLKKQIVKTTARGDLISKRDVVGPENIWWVPPDFDLTRHRQEMKEWLEAGTHGYSPLKEYTVPGQSVAGEPGQLVAGELAMHKDENLSIAEGKDIYVNDGTLSRVDTSDVETSENLGQGRGPDPASENKHDYHRSFKVRKLTSKKTPQSHPGDPASSKNENAQKEDKHDYHRSFNIRRLSSTKTSQSHTASETTLANPVPTNGTNQSHPIPETTPKAPTNETTQSHPVIDQSSIGTATSTSSSNRNNNKNVKDHPNLAPRSEQSHFGAAAAALAANHNHQLHVHPMHPRAEALAANHNHQLHVHAMPTHAAEIEIHQERQPSQGKNNNDDDAKDHPDLAPRSTQSHFGAAAAALAAKHKLQLHVHPILPRAEALAANHNHQLDATPILPRAAAEIEIHQARQPSHSNPNARLFQHDESYISNFNGNPQEVLSPGARSKHRPRPGSVSRYDTGSAIPATSDSAPTTHHRPSIASNDNSKNDHTMIFSIFTILILALISWYLVNLIRKTLRLRSTLSARRSWRKSSRRNGGAGAGAGGNTMGGIKMQTLSVLLEREDDNGDDDYGYAADGGKALEEAYVDEIDEMLRDHR